MRSHETTRSTGSHWVCSRFHHVTDRVTNSGERVMLLQIVTLRRLALRRSGPPDAHRDDA